MLISDLLVRLAPDCRAGRSARATSILILIAMLSLGSTACRASAETTLAPPPLGAGTRASLPSAAEAAPAYAALADRGSAGQLEAPAFDAPAAAVVSWWDERRAAAWEALDAAALEELYLPDSRAGEIDADHLAAYAAAGVRVHGWETVRTSVREVRRADREMVVDVVTAQRDVEVSRSSRSGATAVQTRRTLPATSARRLRLSLHWAWPVGGWAVGRVRPVLAS